MRKIITQIIIIIALVSCNGQIVSKKDNNKYVTAKKEFDSVLVSHFPKMLNSYPYTYINNKNISKNDVCFMLYEYNVDSLKIDSIFKNTKYKSVANYSSKDSCILIVNRFETKETYDNRKDVEILDPLLINKECYKNMHPVPNFNIYESDTGFKSNNSLNIYVLEAKSGIFFPSYQSQPDIQMPKNWENGYSRGIAISKEKRTVIYWSIIW
ncbi:hypothetical protein [Flavobacterium sp. CF136]|uniref:hypothetical protein n=1 Tax=Flavobacterium sp. (strain CF136) TaxID=1144313 RepID=UPI000271A79F|nr:hypothetical protein [Flavobacterium sp. CF136]EJL65541.1 hypothetical protein PMI10_01237 [Flavobacterium sp. CF136]